MTDLDLKGNEAKKKLLDLIEFHKIDLDKICVAFSGGKDSTLLLELLEQCNLKNKVRVVFSNTKMEYEATYNFIEYIKSIGGNIEIIDVEMPAPVIYIKHGAPIKSKYTSEMLERLQKHNFNFKEDTFKDHKELTLKYPNCQMGVNGLCGKNIMINCPKYFRKKLVDLDFKVSNKCCFYLKKKPFKEYEKQNEIQLSILGVRKAEGGIRKFAYKGCISLVGKVKHFYPLLYFEDKDVTDLIDKFKLKLSDCYTKYGLLRTGCVGCPFSKNADQELKILEKYEPNKYTAVKKLFGKSFDLQRKEK